MFTNNESSPVLIFLLGCVVGSSFYDDSETIQFLKLLVNIFASIYTIVVFIMLTIMSCRHIGITLSGNEYEVSKGEATTPSEKPLEVMKEVQQSPQTAETDANVEDIETRDQKSLPSIENSTVDAVEEKKPEESLNLIDLNGSFRLEKNVNFQNFLAAQGVNWALRNAANKAITTHHITHKGSMLKIRVSGIINSETEYTINGPPIPSKVKDRVYMDQVSYLEDGQGIKVTKVNEEHNYKIFVVRKFSPDKKVLIVTSTAQFADGKSVEAIQYYRRLEPNEK